MKPTTESVLKIALLVLIWLVWWWAASATLSSAANLAILIGGLLLVFPLVWLGRVILDREPTASRAVWITMFVHVGLGFLMGVPLVRALITYADWRGRALPAPEGVGLALALISGAAFLIVGWLVAPQPTAPTESRA